MGLGTSVAAVVLLAGLAFGTLRVRTRRLVAGTEDETGRGDESDDGGDGGVTSVEPKRLSRVIRRWLVAFAVVTVVALAVTGAWQFVRNALTNAGLPADGPLSALTWVPALVGVVTVVTAGYLGAFPVARDYRGSDLSRAEAARMVVRYQGALAVPLLLALAVGPLVAGSTVGTVVVVVAVLVGTYAAAPWLVRLTQRAWRPESRSARLDRLCERAGVDPDRRYLLNGADSERAYAGVRGPPGYRTLFVTDYLLDELDDEPAAAFLASEAGRARVRHQAVLVAGVTLAAVCAVVAVLGDGGSGTDWVLYALAVAVVALAVAVARQLVYRADDAAASRVGRRALRDALTSVRERRGSAPSSGLRRLLRPQPSLDERLDRLGGGS